MGWVVNATPRPHYPRERPGTHGHNRWNAVKNTLFWSAVACWGCERIKLFFSVTVCVVSHSCASIWLQLCYKRDTRQLATSGRKVKQRYRLLVLAGYVCFPPPLSRMLGKSTHVVQINILLSKGEYSPYELCKILCSLSPLYLNLLLSFMSHKIRRLFLKVVKLKLHNIYLYRPVGMKLCWHDSAMYVMVVIGREGKLQLTCRLLCRLPASLSRRESCGERLRRTFSRNEKITLFLRLSLYLWLSFCYRLYVIILFPSYFLCVYSLAYFPFYYSCYCTGYELTNTCNASLVELCSNPA
jgi:hypothetical protein